LGLRTQGEVLFSDLFFYVGYLFWVEFEVVSEIHRISDKKRIEHEVNSFSKKKSLSTLEHYIKNVFISNTGIYKVDENINY